MKIQAFCCKSSLFSAGVDQNIFDVIPGQVKMYEIIEKLGCVLYTGRVYAGGGASWVQVTAPPKF